MSTTPETPVVDAIEAAAEAAKNLTPEERTKQFQAFMGKVMGDVARLSAQVGFVHRQAVNEAANITERLDYLTGVIAMVCEALHIEMPQQTPKLLEVRVEIVEQIEEGETCECRVSWSNTPHPVFGNLQILLGPEDDAQLANPAQMNPVFVRDLTTAAKAWSEREGFVDGKFYYARLNFVHAKPLNETSVAIPAATTVQAAANDDAAEAAAETGDVVTQ